MPDTGHIYKPFDAELRALKDQILAMGGLVEAQIAEAMKAFSERDAAHARKVRDSDGAVNRLELAIDEQCIRMLALRQPAASDLRFIAAALKMVTDLERIGDLAVNIAERAEELAAAPPLQIVVDVPRMAEAAQKMLRAALDAFVERDAEKAKAVLSADDQIDKWLVSAFDLIRAEMKRDPGSIDRGISMISLAKHLERLADHTTNIAEMVVYLVRGQDVRHPRTR